MKLRINPLALQDLLSIKDYITNELGNPEAANNIIVKIIESYEKLNVFPLLGMELSSRIDVVTDYRYLISGSYIIFYKFDHIQVSIYRILYVRRDHLKILFNDETL